MAGAVYQDTLTVSQRPIRPDELSADNPPRPHTAKRCR
jgi:hypothetical protein